MNLTAIVMASILVAVKQKKKSKKKKEPDPSTLSSSHLMAMVATLALLRGLYPFSNGVSGNESTAIKDGSHQGESTAVVSTDKECPREETEEGAVGGSLGHTEGLCDRKCE